MLSANPTKITVRPCFIRTSSIGDVVLATSCLDLMKQLPVSSACVWVGRPPTLEWIRTFYPGVVCLDADELEREEIGRPVWRDIVGCHFAIDLQKNIRSVLLGRTLSKFRDIPTYTWQKDSWRRGRLVLAARLRGRSSPVPDSALVAPTPQYRLMQEPLKRALSLHLPEDLYSEMESVYGEPRISIDTDLLDRYPVISEVRAGRWLALGIGGAHPTKQAPERIVIDILERLKATQPSEEQSSGRLNLVFVGDEQDRARANSLIEKFDWKGATLNLAGKLSLVETTLVLSQCSHLVTNDSSLSHLAEAAGTSVSVLFGPTIEGFGFAPRLKDSRAFSSRLGCRPCSKHGKVECRFRDQQCFLNIDPRAVADYVSGITNRHPDQA